MIFDKNAGSACLEMNRSNIAPLWNLFLGQPRFLGKCDITAVIDDDLQLPEGIYVVLA